MTQTDIELARITRDAILTASRKGSCSWHNDACPSFMHEATGLHLFAGYPAGHASAFDDAPRFTFAQCITRTDGAGWQLDSDAVTVLECDTIGEVRDLLDSVPYLASMADALRSARMRLNQLTADDARELMAEEIAFGEAGGKACPDLIGQMQTIIDCDSGMHSWIGAFGLLPADTRCGHCGEVYGCPE